MRRIYLEWQSLPCGFSKRIWRVTKTCLSGENQAMHPTRIFILSASLFLIANAVSGCGTLQDGKPNLGVINRPAVSGDPCRNADWFEVGRVDGLSGVPTEASTYVNRCVSLGVAIDEELYNGGWQRGLVDYCTPERAFDAGRSGESYSGVCPANLEVAFLKRFKLGERISALEKKNILIESEVDRKLSELHVIESTAASPPTTTILNDALSRSATGRRAEIENELKRLRDTIAKNENLIRDLENSLGL